MMLNCSEVNTMVRTTSTQMSFLETVSDHLCRSSLIVQTQFHQLSGWLVSDDPAVKEAGCGGPVLVWGYMWPAVVRKVGRTAKFPKTTLKVPYGRNSYSILGK
jgi:hypothetical protein